MNEDPTNSFNRKRVWTNTPAMTAMPPALPYLRVNHFDCILSQSTAKDDVVLYLIGAIWLSVRFSRRLCHDALNTRALYLAELVTSLAA